MGLLSGLNLPALNEVPDKIPVIPTGDYVLRINACEQKAKKDATDATQQNLVCDFEVLSGIGGSETPQKGAKTRRYFSLPNSQDDPMKARNKMVFIKQLVLSCGIEAADFMPADLVNKTLNASVVIRMDDQNNEQNDIRVLRSNGSKF